MPLAGLAKELEEQPPLASAYQDLPRGRKRAGWKQELARSLAAVAQDPPGVTEPQIAEVISGVRAEKKRLSEIRRRSVGIPSTSFLRDRFENDTVTWLVTEEILSEYKQVLTQVGRSTEPRGADHQPT
jgi:hypothetical protein